MEFAFEEMKYDNLKDYLSDDENPLEMINHDKIHELVNPYCPEEESCRLVAILMPLLEISYRIGYIKGLHETSEEQVQSEFANRDFNLHSQLRNWLKNQDDELYVRNGTVDPDEMVERTEDSEASKEVIE